MTHLSMMVICNRRFRYNRKKVISQSFATTGPIVTPTRETAAATEPEGTLATKCVFIPNATGSYKNRNTSGISKVYENWQFTFSDLNEADGFDVKIYWTFYAGQDRFEIYQSNSPISESNPGKLIYTPATLAIQPFTDVDKRKILSLNPVHPKLFDGKGNVQKTNYSVIESQPYQLNSNVQYFSRGGDPKHFFKFGGLSTFPYVAADGRYFRIRIVKYSQNYSFSICYPITKYNDPATETPSQPASGKLLRTYCTTSQDLIGIYADGKGGT